MMQRYTKSSILPNKILKSDSNLAIQRKRKNKTLVFQIKSRNNFTKSRIIFLKSRKKLAFLGLKKNQVIVLMTQKKESKLRSTPLEK